ncbi:hypothetical protein BC936DRAFT_142299, partial [Jimgerdemannia flammicorona]
MFKATTLILPSPIPARTTRTIGFISLRALATSTPILAGRQPSGGRRDRAKPVRHRHHGRRTVRIQRPDHRGPRAVQHQGGAKVLEEVGVRTSATEQYVIQKSHREFDSTIISTDIISTEFAKPFTPPHHVSNPLLQVSQLYGRAAPRRAQGRPDSAAARYNPERDELKFSAERFPYRPQNKKYLSDLFDRVVEEAK